MDNCIPNGLAQDRISDDLSEEATQEGTIITADIINPLVHEPVHAIKNLGIEPVRNQNNQLAIGFKKRAVYEQVGEITEWICLKQFISKTEALLDGSLLIASDYEDNLEALKDRRPEWISGKNIQLPNYNSYFQRFDSSRLGSFQGDAMRKIDVTVSATLTTPKMPRITIPGRFRILRYSAGGHDGYRTIANVVNHLTMSTALNRHVAVILEKPDKTINLEGIKLKVTKTFKQEGTVDSENRPDNYAILQAVVVGIPKKLNVE